MNSGASLWIAHFQKHHRNWEQKTVSVLSYLSHYCSLPGSSLIFKAAAGQACSKQNTGTEVNFFTLAERLLLKDKRPPPGLYYSYQIAEVGLAKYIRFCAPSYLSGYMSQIYRYVNIYLKYNGLALKTHFLILNPNSSSMSMAAVRAVVTLFNLFCWEEL